ncbi:murein biosynthesis integral membrane protein MurJ [bacterium]
MSLKKSGLILILIAMFSKFLGLSREILIAYNYGTNADYDVYVFSTTIALNLAHFLLGGAFAAAFIPIYSELISVQKEHERKQFAWQIINITFIIAGLMILFGILFSRQLVGALAPGLNVVSHDKAILMNYMVLPTILIISMISISKSVLNTHEKFFLPGLHQTLLNLSLIICMVLFSEKFGIFALSLGFLLGGIIPLAIQFPQTLKKIGSINFKINLKNEYFQKFLKIFLPMLIVMFFIELTYIVDNMIGSYLGEGNISALGYSMRLMDLAKSIIAVSVVTVVFPRLSKKSFEGDWKNFGDALKKGLNVIFIATLPIMLVFLFFPQYVVSIIFERGSFDVASTAITSQALRYYSFAAFFISINYILTHALFSLKKIKHMIYISSISLIINILLNIILSNYMGVAGITLATSIAYFLMFVLLLRSLRVRESGINLIEWLKSVWKITSSLFVVFSMVLYFVNQFPTNVTFAAGMFLLLCVYILLLRKFNKDIFGLILSTLKIKKSL